MATMKTQGLSFLFGGLLPVIVFTVIEEKYGTQAGLIAGMVFGVGEIIVEWRRDKKVSGITWFGNGLLLALGGISLYSQEGLWFKLQPAVMELLMTALLWGSQVIGKPLLLAMTVKQNPNLPSVAQAHMPGINFRLGLFFLIHAALATWAALHWSTEAWAILKGVGVTVSLIVYMVFEMLWMRRSIKRAHAPPNDTPH